MNDLSATTSQLWGIPTDDLVAWLATMLQIREFEEAADQAALRGKIPGGVHSSIGQEAVAVGVIRALGPHDIIAGGHRSHHHAIAKGLPLDELMAELFGKLHGVCGGRGGTMHLADFSRGYFGGNGIVGAGLGIAMGAALAAQHNGTDQVTVGFVGDGGANTGRVWENINLATVWKLPHIIVCENNLYAVETRTDRLTGGESITQRALGFGLPAVQIDGQDIAAVYHATRTARERAQSGDGPTFIEALTYRFEGHSTGEVAHYRTRDEVEAWRLTRDPITRLEEELLAHGVVDRHAVEEWQERARSEVATAIRFADADDWPTWETDVSSVPRRLKAVNQ